MKRYFLHLVWLLFPICIGLGITDSFAQKQDFEIDFKALSFPEEFLENWIGNDVRASSSRIFQSSNQGRNGTKALTVQPISTFDGEIWIRLNPSAFTNPEVIFYAKTLQNGTGNRSALVFYSWGRALGSEFSQPVQLGDDEEFANENRDFRKYFISLAEELKAESEVFLKLTIQYGAGSGSAARWIMDDFEFGDIESDETPPQVLLVKGYDSDAVLVQFSEKVDPVFSILPIAYFLDGENSSLVTLANDSIAVVRFENALVPNENYKLTINQIPDLEGNFMQDTTISFTFNDPTAIPAKGLVINEIMPAPRADQDLPNVEYIELFNAGDSEYRLEGVQLSNSRNTTILGEHWIGPGEFLILVQESQTIQFESFGKVLPVKSWPTLLNSGDQISIKSDVGLLIDQISYLTSSWGGSDFANGGYSLEVPDPFFLCENSTQLKASIDSKRGTPGAENSVFDPTFEIRNPQLKSAYFKDSLQVTLTFTDPILPRLQKEDLVFSPTLSVDSLIFNSAVEIRVRLDSPATANQEYKMILSGLLDCFGNNIPDLETILILSSAPQPGELIINEVLFDPKTGSPKFVEIKNTSQKYLNLENLALANLNSAGAPDQIRVFGQRGMILTPQGFLAITTDESALRLSYPKSSEAEILQISSLPSYPIAGGTVILISSKGEMMESFSYSDKLHHPLLRDTKGVSLERISDQSPATIPSNWQSASANEGYATPGRKNSQSLELEFQSDVIQLDPEVFDPEGSSGSAFTSISYQLGESGWVGTFRIYSAAGQLIQTLAQNQILGTQGLLTWTGTDSTGKLVRSGYYVLVVELYDPNGALKSFKKTIVVATRL